VLFSPVYAASHPRPFTLFASSFEGSLEGLGSPSPFPAGPQKLLFYEHIPPITNLESTLLQVFILKNLKPFKINAFEKQGEGWSLWLTNCSKKVSGGKFAGISALPFSVHTSKFGIPQLLYLPLLRKHRGCGGILPILEPPKFQCFDVQTFRSSPVLSSALLRLLQPRKRAGNDRAHP
jgi:hypothetical protein